MPKRFTDTEKWKDEWFLELPATLKLVWLYLVDNCSNAGRWKKSFKHLNFCCDTNLTEQDILTYFADRVIDCGSFLFIPKFLKFQYPQGLTSNKPAIISIRKELENYNLMEIVKQSLGNHYLMIKDQDKDQDKDIYINKNNNKNKKDKNKKNKKDKNKGDFFDFELLWAKYPNKDGKKEALKHFIASVKTKEDYDLIQQALKNYLESERVKKGYIKNGSTWFNNWKDWIEKHPEGGGSLIARDSAGRELDYV